MSEQTSYTVALGGASATALAFFADSVTKMIPWMMCAIPLIALDLDFGIKAARHRGDRIRVSTAFRRTFGKCVEYFCWIVLAATLSLAFHANWIEWAVLGVVIVNELSSIAGNYLETKDIALSFAGFARTLFRAGANKVGVEVTHEEAKEIIKDKNEQPRDAKGRYTSKKK